MKSPHLLPARAESPEHAPGLAPEAPSEPASRAANENGAGAAKPVPPTLTGQALADELRRSAKVRVEDRTALAEERARLEKLSRDVTAARTAMREETIKLQGLVGMADDVLPAPASKRGPAAAGGARARPTRLDTLAKTVKGMKPDQAAAVVSRLDRPLAAAVLERMRPADAAVVVEKMDPAVGAELLALIARKGNP